MMQAQNANRGVLKRPVSMRVKLLLVFFLMFILILAGIFYWFYRFSTDKAWERIDEDLTVLLKGTVGEIDGNEFEALVREGEPRDDGYTDDERYWAMAEHLAAVKAADPRAKLYTFIKGSNEHEVIFIGSSSALNNPPSGAQFMEHCTDDPDECGDLTANMRALDGELTIQEGVYTDSFGSWHSGYIPIRNSNGEVVGALGIDYRANYVELVQTAVRNGILIGTLVSIAVCFVLVWYTSGAFTRPIRSLTRMAEQIGEGQYDQDFSELVKDRFPDEIDTLATVFEGMVAKVYKREQALREQVQELQIQIDESKRDKQVSEIVDSDFFNELTVKAAELRKRSRGENLTPPKS